MKKEMRTRLVLAVAAVFMLTATSCNGSKSKDENSQEQTENEQAQVESENGENEETEVKTADAFLTHDLATFELRGEVIAVKTKGEHTDPVVALFDDNGNLKGVYEIDAEGKVDEGIVERDDDSVISSITFDSNSPWVTFYAYEEGSMMLSSMIESNQMGNYILTTYVRDKDGNIVAEEYEEAVHGNIVEKDEKPVAKYSDRDSHGNWLTYTYTEGEFSFTSKRTIIYKGEKNVIEEELKGAVND